jgi:hypothetical protein
MGRGSADFILFGQLAELADLTPTVGCMGTSVRADGRAAQVDAKRFGQALDHLLVAVGGRPVRFDWDLAQALLRFYPEVSTTGVVERFIRPFVSQHTEVLRRIYSAYADDPRRPPPLSDPTSLVVFERLNADRFRLRAEWPARRDLLELERMSAIWGVPTIR